MMTWDGRRAADVPVWYLAVGLWTGDRLGPSPLWSARRSLPRGSRSRRSAVYTGSSPVGFPERLRANAELAALDLSSVRRWRRSPISIRCPNLR
jgi:hypothetical protein